MYLVRQKKNINIQGIIFNSGDSESQMRGLTQGYTGTIDCMGENIKIFNLPEGDYYFGGVGRRQIEEENAYKFRVKRNTINYIGDTKLTMSTKRNEKNVTANVALIIPVWGMFLDVNVNDNEAKTLSLFKKSHPQIYKQYRYQKSIAQK